MSALRGKQTFFEADCTASFAQTQPHLPNLLLVVLYIRYSLLVETAHRSIMTYLVRLAREGPLPNNCNYILG